MGDCRFCGKSAGLFSRQHKACQQRNEAARERINDMCVAAAIGNAPLGDLARRVREEVDAGYVTEFAGKGGIRDCLVEGWRSALVRAAEDQMLSEAESQGLNRYRKHFGLDEATLDRDGYFRFFKQMQLLKTIADTGSPPRFDRMGAQAKFGRIPFNIMKSEELLWVFPNTGYMETITKRHFSGGTMGASFKVAKGVYIRPSTFRGSSSSTDSLEHTDTGMFGLTTKHLYFRGKSKSFRIRLERIVSTDAYTDGIGLMRDSQRAKPEAFRMTANDACFVVNGIQTILYAEDIKMPRRSSPTLDDIMEAYDYDDDGSGDDNGAFYAAGLGA